MRRRRPQKGRNPIGLIARRGRVDQHEIRAIVHGNRNARGGLQVAGRRVRTRLGFDALGTQTVDVHGARTGVIGRRPPADLQTGHVTRHGGIQRQRLHVGCTTIASRGLIEVWQRTTTEHRPPRIADCTRMLTTAIIIHALYNATAIAYEVLDMSFGWPGSG